MLAPKRTHFQYSELQVRPSVAISRCEVKCIIRHTNRSLSTACLGKVLGKVNRSIADAVRNLTSVSFRSTPPPAPLPPFFLLSACHGQF